MTRDCRPILLLWLATWAAGCGEPGERFVPVTGAVLIDGKPLRGGTVSFRPDASRGNRSLHHPTGEIDRDGNYRLYTARREGAPPGWYKVLVFADAQAQKRGPVHPRPPQWVVHVKYTAEQTTDLSAEVIDKPADGRYDLLLSK